MGILADRATPEGIERYLNGDSHLSLEAKEKFDLFTTTLLIFTGTIMANDVAASQRAARKLKDMYLEEINGAS